MGDAQLRGRAAEIAVLDALVSDARAGRAGVLDLCGEPGIGKTALAEYAAAAPGLRLLRALGVQGETAMPLAALSELLRPLRPLLGELSPARRVAVASLLDGGGEQAADPYTLGAATLGLLARAAEDAPLLVVVDDVHWVDDLSGRVLAFAFRRLQADAVAVLLCRRPGPRRPVVGPWRELALGGLDAEHTGALLAAAPAVVAAVQQVTGGNPLAVRELRRTLSPAQLAGDAPLPDPLPLADDGTAAFGGRVRSLPEATRLALTVAAAAGPGGTGLLADALARVGATADDLAPAERDGLLVITGGRPAFAHPLMRAAVYAAAEPAQRRAAHAALAQACRNSDLQQHARHLAAASVLPSQEVVAALDAAAQDAERRGGPAAGAAARTAAARLSPDGPARDERRLRAAEACLFAGRRDEAEELAGAVLAGARDAGTRDRALALRATLATWTVGLVAAVPALLAAFDELAGSAPDLAALVALQLAGALTSIGRLAEVPPITDRACRLPLTDVLVRFLLEHRHAGVLSWCGDPTAYERAERRYPLARYAAAARRRYPLHELMSGQQLMLVERFADAAAAIEQDLAIARVSAAPRLLPLPLMQRADLMLLTGDAVRAAADLDEACDLLDEQQLGLLAGYAHALRARAAACAGDEDTALQHADAAAAVAPPDGAAGVRMYRGNALGLLELGRGRPGAALAHHAACADGRRRAGVVNPVAVPWTADHVEALHGAGRTAEARAALDDFDAHATRTGSRWARSTAARCRALLGDPDWADLCAAAVAQQPDLPFERGRTLLLHGELARRARRVGEAREHLAAAVDVFTRFGAAPWAARARAELRATGVAAPEPAPAGPALTGQELRVCLAVADGATNREAGAALFLSPKTVEHHLGRAFAKLGVGNRAQLARLVAVGGLAQLPR